MTSYVEMRQLIAEEQALVTALNRLTHEYTPMPYLRRRECATCGQAVDAAVHLTPERVIASLPPRRRTVDEEIVAGRVHVAADYGPTTEDQEES